MKFIIASVCLLLGSMAVIDQYERMVTRKFADALDSELGRHGWTVIWKAADAQPGQSLSLVRTAYVRLFHPQFKEYTPWSGLEFTHKTTNPSLPWHYCICVINHTREITYYWSIMEGRWIVAWNNRIADFPEDIQRACAARLKSIARRDGLNSSSE